MSAEFHSPDKDRLLPQTPRNETVKLTLLEVEQEPTDRFNQTTNNKIVDSRIGSLALPNASTISTPSRSAGPSCVRSSKHSTPSILPPVAALESIRNSNYAPYAATDAAAHLMRASTTGHIYFRSSTPTEQDKASFTQYLMHPERHRMRSTLASNKGPVIPTVPVHGAPEPLTQACLMQITSLLLEARLRYLAFPDIFVTMSFIWSAWPNMATHR